MKTNFYNTSGNVLQEFLSHLGYWVQPRLMREIQYLKVENSILRSKCPKRITTAPDEKYQILKYGLALGGRIKNLRMAKDNPGWGYPRIRTELHRLFDYAPCRNTVKAVLKANGYPSATVRNTPTWDLYIRRTFETLWACDFFTKEVWTLLGPRIFYVLFFINIKTRRVVITGMTQRPNDQWIAQTAGSLNLTVKGRTLLLRDRDRKFTRAFEEPLKRTGIEIKMLPYKSPNLNPYAESWVSTIRRECLDYFAAFSKKHLEYLIREYVEYFNNIRPHSGRPQDPAKTKGKIRAHPILGGLITYYEREQKNR